MKKELCEELCGVSGLQFNCLLPSASSLRSQRQGWTLTSMSELQCVGSTSHSSLHTKLERETLEPHWSQ